MATSAPCGLSYPKTLEIIKNNVIRSGYNGRDQVMKGLMKEGFTYTEAKAVADQYFKIYRRVSQDFKKSKPNIILTPQQQAEKRLNNIAVDYLNGNIGGFPMNDADIAHLQSIYEKAGKADTATLKEKYNEEAAVFVQTFLPKYSNELFKTAVYARPLLSSVFFIKSITSNLWGQAERSITDSFWDGKRLDFTGLWKFDGLANVQFVNVFKGGVPATSLYQSEQNVGTSKGRLEEFTIQGTEAANTVAKEGYFGIMKFMSKWSNRFNSAPDTRGIFSNAERHMYQLLKEKYRAIGHTQQEAVQLSLKDMELDDRAKAIGIAAAKFKELDIPVLGKNNKYTSEFKVAVAEYQRIHRDEAIWGKALQLSKNDFWKRNLTVASELGFGDYGIFGLKAQLISGLRDKLEKHNNSKVTSAFNLFSFGFLNGAANFCEDAIERMPLYGLVKVLALQSKKGKVSDQELVRDIARRQRDIIAKNIITATFIVAARMAEHLFCKDKENKQSSSEIGSGRTQVGPCGFPILVPPQMMVMYKFYKIMEQWASNDEEFFETAMNVLPVLVQANQIGLGGAADKLTSGLANWTTANSQGNEIRSAEELAKLKKTVISSGTDFANSFLPFPSRLMNEAGTIAQRTQGITQKQQELPFSINEKGKPLGFLQDLGKISVASLGNVTGISEILIAAHGANKTYAVDWQGRKIAQLRGSDITGSGIQYSAADDILATAGVKAPYLNRMQKVEVDSYKEHQKGFLGNVTINKKEVRYLTDNEYFNVSVALGNFNKEYFDKKHDEIVALVKDNKEIAQRQINAVFSSSRDKALEAIEKGKTTQEEILKYVQHTFKSNTKQRLSQSTF